MQVNNTQENTFGDEDLIILKAVFCFIIPSNSEKKMPGADYLLESNTDFSHEDISLFTNTISQITAETKTKYAKNFSQLNETEKSTLLSYYKKKMKRDFNSLSFRVISYYYTNDHVLSAIGIISRPPFPDGNFVLEGDMILFEDVYLRGDICRKT